VNLPVQEIFTRRDSRTRPPPYSRISQIPKVCGSAGSWLRVFTNSRLRGFAGPIFRAIARSRLRGFESSGLQTTAHSRLRDFVSSRLQILAISLSLKTYFKNFMNLDVSRVTGFPKFPNSGRQRTYDGAAILQGQTPERGDIQLSTFPVLCSPTTYTATLPQMAEGQ
jgi:hypothetical protein